jgi:hypothetical protein
MINRSTSRSSLLAWMSSGMRTIENRLQSISPMAVVMANASFAEHSEPST